MVHCAGRVHLVPDQQPDRLGEQHHRDGDGTEDEEDVLDGLLAAEELLAGVDGGALHGCEAHVDHGVDEARLVDGLDGGVEVRLEGAGGHPLEHDHEVHVPEQRHQEDDLRHELEEEVQRFGEVYGVECLEDHPQAHLRHPHQHRKLHLVRVEEQQLVLRPLPRPIQTERRRLAARVDLPLDKLRLGRPAALLAATVLAAAMVYPRWLFEVAGCEDEADAQEVVVDEPGVCGEEAHEGDHVSGGHHALERPVAPLEGVGEDEQVHAEEQDAGAVSDVAVHDAEEEWESDDGEEPGVGLLVAGDAVRVDQLLEGVAELGAADVGGGRLGGALLVRQQEGRHLLLVGLGQQQVPDHVLLCRGVPAVGSQRYVTLKHIERGVDGFLLLAEEAPLLDARAPELLQVGPLGRRAPRHLQ
mmetsp:Transcript_26520/g.65858  ORF Transcript_26520/g.65858 Transcript_26520/m.65858 type:complete len:414 (-) Transcript_26520:1469-2710(-)